MLRPGGYWLYLDISAMLSCGFGAHYYARKKPAMLSAHSALLNHQKRASQTLSRCKWMSLRKPGWTGERQPNCGHVSGWSLFAACIRFWRRQTYFLSLATASPHRRPLIVIAWALPFFSYVRPLVH